jgi:uncharacterized protein YndB with AHSA1/START domain
VKTIHHVIDTDAPPPAIWSALTEERGLAAWFQLAPLDDGRTRLRFWQEYAVELSDDAYGT